MKGRSIIFIAVAIMAVAVLLTACGKKNSGTGLSVFVTDANGNIVTDANGNPVTEEWKTEVIYATNADGEVLTNSSGEKITVKQTRPVVTSVVVRTRPVTNKDGSWQTNKDGSYVTEPVTMNVSQVVTDKKGQVVTQPVTNKNGSKVTEPNGQVVTEPVTEIRTEKVTQHVEMTLGDYNKTYYFTAPKTTVIKTTSIYDNPKYTQKETTTKSSYVGKLPETGKLAATRQWIKGFGGTQDDRFRKILATGDSGFIAMALTYSQDGDLEGCASSGFYTVFVKYDASGKEVWKCPIGSGFTRMNDFAILADGSIIAVGETNASLDPERPNTENSYGALMAKVSSEGSLLWCKHVGGSGPDYLTGVAPTTDGGFVAGGKFISKDGDFAALAVSAADALTIKFSSDGSIEWSQKFGGSGNDACTAIAVDTDGNIYSACQTVSKDGDAQGSNGSVDVYVVKYSYGGEKLWATRLGGSKTEEVEDIYAGSNGCVIAGRYASSDGVFELNRGSYDAFMAHVTADGSINWIRTFGGLKGERFYSVVPTTFGYAAVGISYSDNRDLQSIGNKGGYDAFIMSIDKSGNLLAVEPLAGEGDDGCYDICKINSKTFVVVGETYKTSGSFASISPKAADRNSTAFIAKFEIY